MKIYSENEWSPLKSVILGDIFEHETFDIDFSFKLFFRDYIGWITPTKRIEIKRKYIEELKEDLEIFKKTLEKLNIKIYRPKKLSKLHKIETLFWNSISFSALNVRDLTLILGDNIIETSVQMRTRYFENDLLKDIFMEAFLDGAKWYKMPTPILNDDTIDKENIKNTLQKKDLFYKNGMKNYQSMIVDEDYSSITRYFDIGIDAAQFVRFGKDIIVNISNRNHYLGYLWFKRMFPNYNFHVIHSLVDNHLDSFIVPLCEGVLLLRNEKFLKVMPDFLKDWKILYCPQPKENQFPIYDKDDLMLSTPYIDMNVLSIDGKKIIVNSLFPELIELLDRNGFEPIPVRHKHRRIFGGGFHCFTLDLLREDVE